MRNQNKVLGVFITIIILIFIYGIVQDYLYDYHIKVSDAIELPKTDFIDMTAPNHTIVNRELQSGEALTRYYKTEFNKKMLEPLLQEHSLDKTYLYLMLEKPDAQYFQVDLNGMTLDAYGDRYGKANLWNGIFYIKIDTDYIQEQNSLDITFFSEYMTGVTGRILIMSEHDYKTLVLITSHNERILDSAIVIALFASIILLIMLIAWKDQLYNRMTYVYFLLSILALAVSLLDSQKIIYMLTPYLLFKKIIIVSFHVAATFAALAINALLNVKRKWSLGMLGLALILMAALATADMIAFRSTYVWFNYFLIAAMLEIIATIIYYRKRAVVSASVLLIGFSLAGLTTLKLVVVSNYVLNSSASIDLSLLIVIYITMVLFLFYIEMLQIVVDYDVGVVEDRNELGITNHMQGSFTIDSNYCVAGAYATACDHIFNRRIMGVSIMDLLCDDPSEIEIMKVTLESIFDEKFEFKEGFLALLPESIEIDERVYQLNYNLEKHSRLFLRVTLSDVTRSVELEKQLEIEKKQKRLIINALKSRQEISYFIERIHVFIECLREKGFTVYYRSELHAIKGNAGQFGFHQFERMIHTVEDALQETSYDTMALIKMLEESFNDSLDMLEDDVGSHYFEDGHDQLLIDKEEVQKLEKMLDEAHDDPDRLEDFSKALKRLRYITLNDILARYRNYIERLSEDTGKNILPFETAGDLIKVSPEKAEDFSRTLVAIIRNAVVHGIEFPEMRVNAGKESYGRIYCTLTQTEEAIEIIIGDDGIGVDRTILVNKAVQYGIITKDEAHRMTEDEKLELIFESGMSRLDDMDILAGRGIGLYSVKESIRAMQGKIEVATFLGQGTEFKLTLPLEALCNE